jgi:hypothetical protein
VGYNLEVYIGTLRGWGVPFYQPHKMKKDHFVAQNKALNGLEQLGVELGANPDTSNPMNALRSVTKAVQGLVALDKQAKQMGYKSAALALKALSQIKEGNAQAADMLPDTLRTLPNIWLSGKPEGKKTKGFVGLTLSKALRRHRVMMPLMIEVWQLIAGNEELQEQVIYNYLRMSSDDFEKELFRYIYELEEVPLEEEFEDVVAETFDDIMDTYNYMMDPKRIYGVTDEPMPAVKHDEE